MSVGREIEDIARAQVHHQHDHPPVRDLNRESDRRTSRAQRVADDFGRLVGSWTFIFLQTVLTGFWLVLNVVAATNHWDPYPFRLLNLVLSFEAALWASIVLMALSRGADRDRLRAQHRFETDVKAEEEIKMLMTHLEVQDEVMLQILHRLDRSDRELRRLTRGLGATEEPAG